MWDLFVGSSSVADELDTITCEDAAAWEAWLAANHDRVSPRSMPPRPTAVGIGRPDPDPSSIRENSTMDAGDMDLGAFVELETKVWEALQLGDAEADARLLAEDFLGVYPSGFADRSAHAGQLASGPTVAEFELRDARLMVLSDNHVLLAYRADWRRVSARGRAPVESMYISSLWSRREGGWVNVFSQDSPVAFPESTEPVP